MTTPPPSHSYRLRNLIGQGAYGEVYLAEQTSGAGFSRKVAIKLLHDRLQSNTEACQRIRDEARILGQIDHRSVVKVLDLIQLEGRWAVVMDYLPGIDLDQLIALLTCDERAVPLRVLLQIGASVSDALDTAFCTVGESGQPLSLVHRDIKPSNIRLTKDGEVKVMDFGIALVNMEAREAETATNAVMGTLAYLAPERITMTSEGPEGDIYALCATLMEGVLGHPMGRSPVLHDKHALFVEDSVTLARSRLEGELLAEPFLALMVLGLSANPSDRPTARQFAEDFSGLLLTTTGATLPVFCRTIAWDSLDGPTKRPALTLGVHHPHQPKGTLVRDSSLSTLPEYAEDADSSTGTQWALWTALLLVIVVGSLMSVIWVQDTWPQGSQTLASAKAPAFPSTRPVRESTEPAKPIPPVELPPPASTSTSLPVQPTPVPSPITSALGAVRPPIETTLPVTEPAQLPPETVKTEIVNPSLDLGPPVRPPAIVWRGLWTGAEQGRLFSLELNEPKDGKLSGRAIITLGSQSRTIAVNGRLKDNTVQLIGETLALRIRWDDNSLIGPWMIGKRPPLAVKLTRD